MSDMPMTTVEFIESQGFSGQGVGGISFNTVETFGPWDC